MKRLILMRHAKSDWGDPGLPDHDRPLNKRGRRAATALGHWLRDIAPSDGLRKWYRHEAAKWEQFRQRYFQELESREQVVEELLALCDDGPVTLLYSSKERNLNNAVALREYLLQRLDDADG